MCFKCYPLPPMISKQWKLLKVYLTIIEIDHIFGLTLKNHGKNALNTSFAFFFSLNILSYITQNKTESQKSFYPS